MPLDSFKNHFTLCTLFFKQNKCGFETPIEHEYTFVHKQTSWHTQCHNGTAAFIVYIIWNVWLKL